MAKQLQLQSICAYFVGLFNDLQDFCVYVYVCVCVICCVFVKQFHIFKKFVHFQLKH